MIMYNNKADIAALFMHDVFKIKLNMMPETNQIQEIHEYSNEKFMKL